MLEKNGLLSLPILGRHPRGFLSDRPLHDDSLRLLSLASQMFLDEEEASRLDYMQYIAYSTGQEFESKEKEKGSF